MSQQAVGREKRATISACDPLLIFAELKASTRYRARDRIAAKEDLDRLMHIMPSDTTLRVDYLAYLYGRLGEPERAATLIVEQGASPEVPQSDVWETPGWTVLGTRDSNNALRIWAATIDGYLNGDEAVGLGRITCFRDNWLNDPLFKKRSFSNCAGFGVRWLISRNLGDAYGRLPSDRR